MEGSWGSRGQLVGVGALGMGLEPAPQALGVSLEESLGVGKDSPEEGFVTHRWQVAGQGGGAGG